MFKQIGQMIDWRWYIFMSQLGLKIYGDWHMPCEDCRNICRFSFYRYVGRLKWEFRCWDCGLKSMHEILELAKKQWSEGL